MLKIGIINAKATTLKMAYSTLKNIAVANEVLYGLMYFKALLYILIDMILKISLLILEYANLGKKIMTISI